MTDKKRDAVDLGVDPCWITLPNGKTGNRPGSPVVRVEMRDDGLGWALFMRGHQGEEDVPAAWDTEKSRLIKSEKPLWLALGAVRARLRHWHDAWRGQLETDVNPRPPCPPISADIWTAVAVAEQMQEGGEERHEQALYRGLAVLTERVSMLEMDDE